MPLGYVNHPGRQQAQHAAENKGDYCNHEQVRQLGVNEFLSIDRPLVQHFAQKPPFREQACSCRQQKWMHGETPVSRLDCQKGLGCYNQGSKLKFPAREKQFFEE
jgi:hypothetical protein